MKWITILLPLAITTSINAQMVVIPKGKDTAYINERDTTVVFPLLVEGPTVGGAFPKLIMHFHSASDEVKLRKTSC